MDSAHHSMKYVPTFKIQFQVAFLRTPTFLPKETNHTIDILNVYLIHLVL